MYIPFKELPDTSRIWIYQANRSFTEEELEEIKARTEAFLKEWTVHGAALQAGFEIRYKRFIIIGLNQEANAASGCSIDASVHFIQQLEKNYEVDLLDKMNVSYKQGEFVAYKTLTEFREMAKNKAVSGKTIVFNNLVANKQEYEEHWEVPAAESWHSRFIKS
ncbi:ABC transporter ATPase [Sinomicrobium weinanense]|uniref:ABC transporter ATPase n=1 Tax=Sinomicrobium weinanense TaxID=2842200 RepID=A0A926Q264_9FLAO|nr:ABC transporter ATPase [Sinomicrobium weinanense]MBC9795519.1 ABC transporter ATPase [Sinomicrobium weinanense]MBU3123334.1 ABC transporter ATPase [Sinomicrobium weinanense]